MPPFQITWRGEPLQEAEFQHTLPLGILVRPQTPGTVSDYEERRVAAECSYQWQQWLDLSSWERAACVAHSRVKRMIDQAANDVEYEWNKRQMRQGRH